jgi:hypothetical protein
MAGHLLNALYWSVRDGKKIDNIPGLIEQLLAEDIWKEVYVEETERTVTYERFEDFVSAPPPEGLGAKVRDLERLIGDDEATLNLLDAALQGKPGNPIGNNQHTRGNVDNVNASEVWRPTGNSRVQGIRRLRKDRPDLLQRVFDKEMSVNEAMIEAGFRKKQLTVMKDVELVSSMLKREFDQEDLDRIIELLREG